MAAARTCQTTDCAYTPKMAITYIYLDDSVSRFTGGNSRLLKPNCPNAPNGGDFMCSLLQWGLCIRDYVFPFKNIFCIRRCRRRSEVIHFCIKFRVSYRINFRCYSDTGSHEGLIRHYIAVVDGNEMLTFAVEQAIVQPEAR